MHILVIVIGVLLALFGGACTILLSLFGASNEIGLSVLSLLLGLALIWIGVVMDRKKRKAKYEDQSK